ncbi:uncharacterized protein LOC111043677 [Nilaparvata lugens]|uniref:uncharacterized protein LOC111043677 n=1 Tax=Nilaparvata lugens TaxID=108931 RepID=UPI00193CF19B|nr:uncharacterized protein LOC111043677 [Nilaparvata lugens]
MRFPTKEKNFRKERRVDRSTRTLSLETEKQNSVTHHHHHHRPKRRRRPHSRKKATAKNRSRNRYEEEGETESDSNDSDGQTRSGKIRHRTNESAGRGDRKHRSRSSRSRSRSCDRLMNKWKKRAIDKTRLRPIMDDSRLKDNVLMRKLLQSESLGVGDGAKTVADNTSDLSCEVGSLSTVSSPDYTFLERMHPPQEQQEKDCSDDSEIEVIIPHKPPPPVIELDSDGEVDEVVVEEEDEEEPAPGPPQQRASSDVALRDEDDLNALNLRAIALKSAMLRKYQDRVERGDRQSAMREMRLQQRQARLSAMREMILEEEQNPQEQEHSLQGALAERRHDKYMRRQLGLNNPISKCNFTDLITSSEEDDGERDSYHPSNRTSPMSPTSSYNFSPTQECHTEQDIDIDDPDENVEQPRIVEQTYDGSNNAWFTDLGPQPLPPGVDVSNLPPEFSDSVLGAPPPPPPPLPPPPLPHPDADHRFGFQGGFPPLNYFNQHPHTFVGPHFGPVPHPNEPTSHVGQNFGPVPYPNEPSSHVGQNFGPVPHPNVPTSHMGQNFGPVPHPIVPSSHMGQNFGPVPHPNVPSSHMGQNFGPVPHPNEPSSHLGQNFGPVPYPNLPTSHLGQNFGPVPHPNDPTSHVGPNFGSMQNPDETMPHMGSSFVPAEPTIPPHMLPQSSFDNIPSTTTLPLHTRRTMENESSLPSVRQLEHCSVSGEDKLLNITKTIYTNSNRQLEPCVVANQRQKKVCAANQITNLNQLERFINNQRPLELRANQSTNLEQLTTKQSTTHQRQLEHSFATSSGNQTKQSSNHQRQVEHSGGNQTNQSSTHQRQVENYGGNQNKSVLRTIYSMSRQLEPCVMSSANQRQLSEQASTNQRQLTDQATTNQRELSEQASTNQRQLSEQASTNQRQLSEQATTNQRQLSEQASTNQRQLSEQASTNQRQLSEQASTNKRKLSEQASTNQRQLSEQASSNQLETLVPTVRQECAASVEEEGSNSTGVLEKNQSSDVGEVESCVFEVGDEEDTDTDGTCNTDDENEERLRAKLLTALLQKKGKSDRMQMDTGDESSKSSSREPSLSRKKPSSEPVDREDVVMNEESSSSCGRSTNASDPIHKRDLSDFIDTIRATASSDVIHDSSSRPVSLATTKAVPPPNRIVSNRIVKVNSAGNQNLERVVVQNRGAKKRITTVPRQSTAVARQSTAITPATRQSTAAQEDSNKFIIRIGEDSEESNGEDEENGRVWRRKVIMAAEEEKDSSVSTAAADPYSVEMDRSIDKLLEEMRRNHEVNEPSTSAAILEKSKPTTVKVVAGAKGVLKKGAVPKSASPKLTAPQATTSTQVSTPAAVKHLPKSAQEEYRRLKQAMVVRERQKRMEAVRQRLLQKNRQVAATSCPTSAATATSRMTPTVTGACVTINCVNPPVTAAIAVTSCATPQFAATSDTMSPANTTVAATNIQTAATVANNVFGKEKDCQSISTIVLSEEESRPPVAKVSEEGISTNMISFENVLESVTSSAAEKERSSPLVTLEEGITTVETNVASIENVLESISSSAAENERSSPLVTLEEGITSVETNVASIENVLESISSSAVEKEKSSSLVTLEEGITTVETNVASIENVFESAVEEEKSSPLVATEKSSTNAQLLSSVIEEKESCTIESRSSSNDRETCPATPGVVTDEDSQSTSVLEGSESCQNKSSSPQVDGESCATPQLPEIVAEKECSNSVSVVGKSSQSPAIVAECSNSVTLDRKNGSVVVLGGNKSCEISPSAAIGEESCKPVTTSEESCVLAVSSSELSCKVTSKKSDESLISDEQTFQSASLKEAEKSCQSLLLDAASFEKNCVTASSSAEKSSISVSSSEKSCQTTPAMADKICMTEFDGFSADNSKTSSSSNLAAAEHKLISTRYSAVDKLTELARDQRAETDCRERVARFVLQLRAERAELARLEKRVERRASIGQLAHFQRPVKTFYETEARASC